MSRFVPLDLEQLLADLRLRQFYGKVEIEIARGEPKALRVAETTLPEGENRKNEYHATHER